MYLHQKARGKGCVPLGESINKTLLCCNWLIWCAKRMQWVLHFRSHNEKILRGGYKSKEHEAEEPISLLSCRQIKCYRKSTTESWETLEHLELTNYPGCWTRAILGFLEVHSLSFMFLQFSFIPQVMFGMAHTSLYTPPPILSYSFGVTSKPIIYWVLQVGSLSCLVKHLEQHGQCQSFISTRSK